MSVLSNENLRPVSWMGKGTCYWAGKRQLTTSNGLLVVPAKVCTHPGPPLHKGNAIKIKMKRKLGNWECLITSCLLGQWFYIKFPLQSKRFSGSPGCSLPWGPWICVQPVRITFPNKPQGTVKEFFLLQIFILQILSDLFLQNQKKQNLNFTFLSCNKRIS